jgi:hypothetical protein
MRFFGELAEVLMKEGLWPMIEDKANKLSGKRRLDCDQNRICCIQW